MKFTEDVIKKMVQAVEDGAKPSVAAAQAGVAYRTFCHWKFRSKTEPEYAILFEKLKKAAATHENKLVRGMDALAMDSDYRALSYLLTNRYGWGQDASELVSRVLDVAEEVLSPECYEKFEQAIIDGALDLDS